MRIVPLGESAVVVEFGREISPELNDKAIALARELHANPFPGFREAIPCYASVGVYFEPLASRSGGQTGFEQVCSEIEQRIEQLSVTSIAPSRLIEVPVDLSDAAGPDLPEMCETLHLSKSEFANAFFGREYRVYMLGFLPGFAYMGELDPAIGFPRLPTPRLRVPKGSVGIAGRQTGIYPAESPGGWRIIGRTELELFDASRDEPSLFRPGDRVRFFAA